MLFIDCVTRGLVKKNKAYVIIRFLFLCFRFLLSLGSSSGGGRTSCRYSTSCWGRSTSLRIVDEVSNMDIGQSLCKQDWPERVNTYPSCLHLTLCHGHFIFLQDKGPVDAGTSKTKAMAWASAGRALPLLEHC